MDAASKQNFINILKANLDIVNINASGTEAAIRCFFCGDSTKSGRHAHLYISLNSEYGFPYYCQKCLSSGLVNKNFLRDHGIADYNLSMQIENDNKKLKSLTKHYRRKMSGVLDKLNSKPNLIIPDFNGTKTSIKKINYINNRFSFNLEPEE